MYITTNNITTINLNLLQTENLALVTNINSSTYQEPIKFDGLLTYVLEGWPFF